MHHLWTSIVYGCDLCLVIHCLVLKCQRLPVSVSIKHNYLGRIFVRMHVSYIHIYNTYELATIEEFIYLVAFQVVHIS